jgi:ABC-type dipeptide/oligopeptide/nickel transport system permease subunit
MNATSYPMRRMPQMVVFPASAVMLAVLAFDLIGDAWRDWLNPRTRSQKTALEQSHSSRNNR